MDDLTGRVIGSYRLERIIDRGATGDIYVGAQVSDGRRVAVRALHPAITVGSTFRESFTASMRTASSLRHRNVIALCDFGVSGDLYFLVMDLTHAGSVRDLLQQRLPGDPLALPLALGLICQAAEGLAYTHERGVIHNNLQPSNLLLDDADEIAEDGGETYTLKIAGFGLAQLVGAASGLTSTGSLLGSGVMLGAPAYMSPELCRGRTVDVRSDLYSLGVVLYEMLTGILPYPGSRLEDVARAHRFTPPTLPRLLNPEIPPALEYVMLRCMAKEADDRFSAARDLARAVRAATPFV